MIVIEYTEVLHTTTCYCGIHLAVPANLLRQVRDEGSGGPNGDGGLYCPLGHKFYFHESELDRERKRREQAEQRAQRADQRRQAERDLREHTEAKLRAQKGATTRARKRAAAGVCPCCHRSFENVRRHMTEKHPGFDPAKSE